ncbi:MAG: hypothetical protein A2Z20_11380 [Bdellovibrionales bacterium RBG_16_40_8]|nr:MAG: hypothetical protein A2Z20_11380 [Bdellovibrionales bacterium RBG_16_40_8]
MTPRSVNYQISERIGFFILAIIALISLVFVSQVTNKISSPGGADSAHYTNKEHHNSPEAGN